MGNDAIAELACIDKSETFTFFKWKASFEGRPATFELGDVFGFEEMLAPANGHTSCRRQLSCQQGSGSAQAID